MNKRIVKALTIGLCTVMLVPNIVLAKEFKDVKKNGPYGWAYSYIDELSDKGIIEGYPNGNYEPDKAVSFEEVHQLIKGIINPTRDEINKAVEKYGSDIEKSGVASWAKEAIAISIDRSIITTDTLKEAKQNGFLSKGVKEKDLVYPNRNTIAVYYARALKLSAKGDESLLKHTDKDDIPISTRGYLASLVKENIFSPTGSDGKFEGKRYIRRSEMAKITKLSYDYAKSESLNTQTLTATGKVVLATTLNNLDTVIIEKDSKRSQFRVNASTTYKINGQAATFKDIKPEQEVKITYVTGTDSTVTGIAKTVEVINSAKNLIGYVTNTHITGFTAKYRTNDSSVDTTKADMFNTTDNAMFTLANGAKIYELGYEIKPEKLSFDELVEFKTDSSGKVTEAVAYPKTGSVTGYITKINSATSTTKSNIVLRLADGKEYTFYENQTSNFSSIFTDLRIGQNVTFTTNYKIAVRTNQNQSQNIETGRVINVRPRYSYENQVTPDLEVVIRTANKDLTLYTDKNTGLKVATGGYLSLNQNTLYNQYVRAEVNGNYIRAIEIIDPKASFDAVAQVISVKNDNAFGGALYNTIYTVRIIESNNPYLKLGSEKEISIGTSNTLNRLAVIRMMGTVDQNGDIGNGANVQFLRNENYELTPASSYTNNNVPVLNFN
ncbi:S-layer homology domain-containing protein [Peptoniphilus sp. oral taxon 386]|uniref:S-layer homology domain-containing protein n=1 Tax=Peptoniphilus sp. oral taxon 386 TaxID=652713 RepID=UPI0001DA9B3B|nr:S-layer homology domain-containing protein [Peptoniphilus sp. oral taxon 386]EFI42133.1 hypothetical protein HMPREF0629_00773 [Peptoniphilus sp. oral taxon 386 str. F0131]